MKPRRIVHRGNVQASAFLVDPAIIGASAARRRILELPGVEEVRRGNIGFFVKLRAPVWVNCNAAAGLPLVFWRGILSAMPLDPDELEQLDAAPGSIVVVRAGKAIVATIDAFAPEDLASWIDLSDWHIAPVKPLGDVLVAPLQVMPTVTVDTREAAGIAPLSAEARALAEALSRSHQPSNAGNSSGLLASLFTSFAGLLSGLAAKLGRKSTTTGQTQQSTSLIARPADPAPSSDWSDRLRLALNSAAARLLIWARLASWIGRKQAEYLAKTFDLFDSGDLDEALRHAVPLGHNSDKPVPLALGVPSPRADLTISTSHSGSVSALGFGANVFDALRSRYRKAVEKLEAQGRIKEAAFVLAELLNASEEAVSFLEKHREYRLAAELAEGRKLPPSLVIRQWFLAGNAARALMIARQTGEFAAAIARLDKTHPEHAAALRILWANQLAESGAYIAAVNTIWPVEKSRMLARQWIELGIKIGGTGGLMLLAKKAVLLPEAFDSVVKEVRAIPLDDSIESAEQWQTLAEATLTHPVQPTIRILSRMCIRALLPHAHDRFSQLQIDRLAKLADDRVLSADLRGPAPEQPRTKRIRMRVAGRTDTGLTRHVNEDGYLVALLENGRVSPYARSIAERALPTLGAIFAVADGMGGREAPEVVSLAFNTLTKYIEKEAPTPERIGQILVDAVQTTNAAVFTKAKDDTLFRGCGATITAVWIVGDMLWAAQVGDSRAYVYRNHKLVQITRDHTLINEFIDSGQPLPEDLNDIPRNIITRALGTAEAIKVDLWHVPLRAKDRILLCTDGIHGMLDDAAITKILSVSTPQNVCDLLRTKVYDAGAQDNMAMVVVDVLGNDSYFSGTQEVTIERMNIEPQPNQIIEKRVISRSVADTGAMPVFDAAVLPRGRLLVALGEAGVRVLSREGKTLVSFNQPAHRLVISDHGDRALALAVRGDAYRITRIDLVGSRARHWMDVQLQQFAEDFDGSTWFVAAKNTIFAVDALEDSFQALWQLSEPNTLPFAITRSSELASFHLGREIWTITLPSFRLRRRLPVDDFKTKMSGGPWLSEEGVAITWLVNEDGLLQPAVRTSMDAAWVRFAEGLKGSPEEFVATIQPHGPSAAFCGPTDSGRFVEVFDMRTRTSRMRVDLEGSTHARIRFQDSRLVIADDRGRVLVIHPDKAEVLAEWRI